MPRPYALRYGSWAPDLANNAVEVSPYQALSEVPSADVNNVYFADASWRCLPAPNPYAYSVGVLLSTTMVTAIDGSLTGFDANAGTLSNAVDASGNTLIQLTSDGTQIILEIQGPNLTATYFASLVFSTGTNPAITLNASDASYAYNAAGSVNTWTWTTATAFAPGVTYALLLEAFAGESVLNALTYYDEVANQELLFAATADGIDLMIDGVWSAITLFGLSGSTISVAAPSFTLTSVFGGVVGPNQSSSFKAKLAMGAPSYLGQLYTGTLSAGSGISGTSSGFISGSFGALTPPADVNAHSIIEMYASHSSRAGVYQFHIGINGNLPQNYFSNFVCPKSFINLLSGAAIWTQISGVTRWAWSSTTAFPFPITAGVNYAVAINR